MNPEPLIEVAIEPAPVARERLTAALQAIGSKIPLAVRSDETGRIVLGSWSEEQLSDALALLHLDAPGEYRTGALQAAYRATLAKPVEVDFTHKQHSGGTGQFGRIKIKVSPDEHCAGITFIDEIKDSNIPREYIPSVEKGMREQAASGHLIGFPIIDFEVCLYDGAYHEIDSSALAFEIAGRGAMCEAVEKAGIRLLEPIMSVEVVTPEDYLGDVIGDINSRHGLIQGTDTRGNAQAVKALVPLANMLGYANELRSFTQDRARYTMQFSHYEEMQGDGGPPDTEPAAAALRA